MMATAHELGNEWSQPYHVYGPGEGKLRRNAIRRTGDYRIDEKEWKTHTQETDKFLDNVTARIQENTAKFSEELSLESRYVRQASARQGLKIHSPDEFDIIVPIRIKGIDFEQSKVRNGEGNVVAGYHKQRVMNKNVSSTHPRLTKNGVFQQQDGNLYLNAKHFHEKVWTGAVDKALDGVKKGMPDCEIVRRVHPPTVNVQVTSLSTGNVTNFDIVPGVLLSTENIQIPSKITGKGVWNVQLPIYAVPKQANKNIPSFKEADRPLLFRMDTSSHERCMADLCRGMKERQYIMTANRILKAGIEDLKKHNNPLATSINSYHLKNIAYHVVYDKTMRDTPCKITGVKDALGTQITELRNCLEKRYLPDFHLGNRALNDIFPGSMLNNYHRQQNLFWKTHPQQLLNASRHGFPQMLDSMGGLFTCSGGC